MLVAAQAQEWLYRLWQWQRNVLLPRSLGIFIFLLQVLIYEVVHFLFTRFLCLLIPICQVTAFPPLLRIPACLAIVMIMAKREIAERRRDRGRRSEDMCGHCSIRNALILFVWKI